MIRSFAAFLLVFAPSLTLALTSAPTAAWAGDPVPNELRTLAYSMVGGPAAGFEPTFSDPAFTTPDEDGEVPDVFDFGSTAPAFATGAGGRRDFAFSLASEGTGRVRALNRGRLTFGSLLTETPSALAYGPNSFEETALVDRDVTAFANWDIVNTVSHRLGFDVRVRHSTLAANGFSSEETSSELGASFSADLHFSPRLALTGRAGINLSPDATRAHFDATANKATTRAGELSLSETGFRDAYVQGGLSFALTRNLSLKADLGYAREIGPGGDGNGGEGSGTIMGTVGAAWKIRF